MTEKFPSGVTLGEDVPNEQIEAFGERGRQLFAAAKQRFGLRGPGVGRTDTEVLDHVRYRTKEGELVTILNSAAAIEADESVIGSISVTIETSLPWSFDFPNSYVRETFIFAGFDQADTYEYSFGVNEYTLEGDPIQGHTVEDVRNAYHKAMKVFQPECTPEHFTDQMLTMVQLRPGDEVGFDPNPYYQLHRG